MDYSKIALFTDLDGTLFDDDKKVSQRNIAAIETGGKQMSTGHLLLDEFKSLYTPHKIKKTPGWVSFLFGGEGGI